MDQATGVRLNKPHKAADPRQGSQIRDRRGAAITARKRALSEWDKKNPGTVANPELFRREILPRLGTVPLSEIMEAAGCSRRPRPTTDGGSGRRMFRRGGRSTSRLASAFEDTSQPDGESSHSPPDQPGFRPPLPQGDR